MSEPSTKCTKTAPSTICYKNEMAALVVDNVHFRSPGRCKDPKCIVRSHTCPVYTRTVGTWYTKPTTKIVE